MQTVSLYSYAKDTQEFKASVSIAKKEAIQKSLIFAGILSCLILAVFI